MKAVSEILKALPRRVNPGFVRWAMRRKLGLLRSARTPPAREPRAAAAQAVQKAVDSRTMSRGEGICNCGSCPSSKAAIERAASWPISWLG